MSRKKILKTKAKKITNKSKNPKKNSSSILSMEKELRSLPAKLVKQLRKESTKLKKLEGRVQSSLKKLQAKKKNISNKHDTLAEKAQNNKSAALKARISAMKKLNDKLDRNTLKLTDELNAIQSQLADSSQKQDNFLSISKEIAQWDKKTKTTKSSKKTSPAVEQAKPQSSTENIEETIDSSYEPAEMES